MNKKWRFLQSPGVLAGIALCIPATALAFQEGGGLTVTPTSFTFNAVRGGAAPPAQTLRITASSPTRFTATAAVQSGGTNWLHISPSGSLTTNRNISVSVSLSGLAAGTFSGTITISRNDRRQTVPVRLVVATGGGGSLTVSPTSFNFSAAQGGSAPPSQSLSVTASSTTTFTASAAVTGGGSWLSISPSGSLTTNRTIAVSVNPTGLSAGTFTGAITITSSTGTTNVPVTLVVAASGGISVSPTSFNFNAAPGGPAPATQSLSVTASAATAFTAAAAVTGGGSWLSISPSGSLTTNRTITVSVNITGLSAGTFTGAITITSTTGTISVPVTLVLGSVTSSSFTLVGWNDLGMHCFDGADYSVFGVLPPYNTIHAHLISKSTGLISSGTGYTLTYHAIQDPLTGTINATSAPKSNFWTYVAALGLGSPAPDMGLKGFAMPGASNTPRAMQFSTADNSWIAEGIPMMPFADAPAAPYPVNYFPMMRLTARDSAGSVLATTDIVLPTSDEMTCGVCHASSSGNVAAMPAAGWANNAGLSRDMKLNILRKHDDRFAGLALFKSAATSAGYNPAGLEVTTATKPVFCYNCHASNALAKPGVAGIEALTVAMHRLHAFVLIPSTGQTMDSAPTRDACYLCHPGPKTQCLRGAMATLKTSTGANAIECQSCHGSMSTVATSTRQGWLDMPTCQSCHTGTATNNNGQIAYTSVFSSGTTFRVAVDQTFATNPNTPAAGLSMFRFSSGHGGLQCEACHGSTHAEFPTPIVNDNVQSMNLQGHVGMLVECSTCHATVPTTTTGGPHGLHPVGSTWVSRHQSVAEGGGATACQACHGTDYRGTILSKMQADRTLAGRSFPRGTIIGCYSCHNGPGGG